MATFEEHIEGLTQIDINANSAPTSNELTEILVEGLIHTVNIIITLKPQELSKFTATTKNSTSLTKQGRVLSVMREHDSTNILRPCTPINPSLRYEATDSSSLHFRSKFNPAYYELNNTIFCVPSPNDSANNDLVVTQVKYDLSLLSSDDYNNGDVENFPHDYEYLLGLYGAAMSCNAKANDIHNNMPTQPEAPLAPNYTDGSTVLPELPSFIPPKMDISMNSISAAISKQDFELADKQISLFDKNLELYKEDYESENGQYTKELEVFKSELEKASKDADRIFQVESGEFKSEIEKYSAELGFFKNDLEEAMQEYKWWTGQYVNFMTQYNTGLGIKPPPRKKQEDSRSKKERETK